MAEALPERIIPKKPVQFIQDTVENIIKNNAKIQLHYELGNFLTGILGNEHLYVRSLEELTNANLEGLNECVTVIEDMKRSPKNYQSELKNLTGYCTDLMEH
ncbi:MAG: hypothetical protein U9R08_06035 [Nanoarchaeota archaeon]|nr:hypothetical protein [Nanoarchaeota archaeon]